MPDDFFSQTTGTAKFEDSPRIGKQSGVYTTPENKGIIVLWARSYGGRPAISCTIRLLTDLFAVVIVV